MAEIQRLDLPDPAATEALGAALAVALPARVSAVAYLQGDLGAGKTTLARALLRGLGVAGPIRSPTYTLVERYLLPAGRGECAHLDLYRIADPEELDYLALDELASSARLWLVEWPERGGRRLPAPDLLIYLQVDTPGRGAELRPVSAVGEAWLQAFLIAQP